MKITPQVRPRLITTNLGFPRIGAKRELKKATEAYWAGTVSAAELIEAASDLRKKNWHRQSRVGIDHIPCNDFSFYDHVLDTAVLVGAVPRRYRVLNEPLDRYFAMARGHQDLKNGIDLAALEMTKWFDTNYHYIVPELETNQKFTLDPSKIFAEIAEARALGIEPRPVVIGPISFLLLAKAPLHLVGPLLVVYEELFAALAAQKVGWVQLDEPCLALDLDSGATAAYERALAEIRTWKNRPRLMLTTYFDSLGARLGIATGARFEALHLDLVRAPEQLPKVLELLPSETILSAGVIDGRNIWKADLDAARAQLRQCVDELGADRIWVAPSCSLLHSPVELSLERKLDAELLSWMAFAQEKLGEIKSLGELADDGEAFRMSRAAAASRRLAPRCRNAAVRRRVTAAGDSDLRRHSAFAVREPKQRDAHRLPPWPTTTIGSFPQTHEVRKARVEWRAGRLAGPDYDRFLKEETRRCIERQEAIGLDVLVHGEFERTDMVEYFGEQMDGFAFTSNGWVQSYGSRCVKPPVIYGDVSRPAPMTVEWSRYAQSLTKKPVKGMLTGPVTILQWSFVRNDQPRSETCKQIALALRDEVIDLERAGISMIQVDEPAVREGLPLHRADWKEYLRWAVDAFRLATSGVRDETQIHTHMCYCEFGDILDSVAEMDADVISIETSRSKMELLGDFERFHYPNEVGPGVYDIHSPRVPQTTEIVDLLRRAGRVVPHARLWVNPDCGLKTRRWSEVDAALRNMVTAAVTLRATETSCER